MDMTSLRPGQEMVHRIETFKKLERGDFCVFGKAEARRTVLVSEKNMSERGNPDCIWGVKMTAEVKENILSNNKSPFVKMHFSFDAMEFLEIAGK